MVALMTPPLRLASDGSHERRMFPRKECRTWAQGHRLDHSVAARKQPHLTLALRDLSAGGLSAISDFPLDQGERLVVSVLPEVKRDDAEGRLVLQAKPVAAWDVRGRVIRCEPAAVGYRVALEFEAVPAAA